MNVATVAWRSDYSVGNDEVDRQHAHIIALVMRVEQAFIDGHGRDTIDLIVPYLYRVLLRHCEVEERLMEEVGYPGLEEHRREHRAGHERLESLMRQVENRTVDLLELISFLRGWLRDHLMYSDQKYVQYVLVHQDRANRWAETAREEFNELYFSPIEASAASTTGSRASST